MKKGLFTAFVLAIMSVFIMPFAVNAEDAATLQAKIDAAKDGAVIALDKDYKEDLVVPEGKNITIDLAGHNLTNVSGATILNKGTLTIKGKGEVTNTTNGKAVLDNEYGKVTIDNGTFKRVDASGNSFYVIMNHGDMIINDGTVAVENGISSLIENGWTSSKDNTTKALSTLKINGGTFNIVNNDKYIKNDECGVLTVDGGTFNMNKPASAVIGAMGSETGKEVVTINGGTFNYTGTNVVVWDYDWGTADKSVTTINGGVYNTTDKAAAISNVEINEEAGCKEYTVIGSDEKVVVNENDLKLVAESTTIKEDTIKEDDLVLIKKEAGNKTIIGYFDINLYKEANGNLKVEQVTENTDKVKVTLEIPKDVAKVADGYNRQYYVVRLHDGKTDLIKCIVNDDGTVSFETDKFSTYTLTYTDVKAINNSVTDNPNTLDSVITYIIIGLVSAMGLAGIGFYVKKRI